MDKHVLEADSIIKNFGERQLLTDIYLKCETGEVIGLLGRNGCGKSTLLKIIFGTVPSANKSIRINKKYVGFPYKRRGVMAYLPQHNFLPNLKIESLVNIFLNSRTKASKILKNERIARHLHKKPGELSGGEARYLEVLLLVNLDVKFVILDEPFSGIEPLYKDPIKEVLQEHKTEKGFIITDHDYRNIIDVSSKIVLLTDGSCRHIQNLEELEQWNYVPPGAFDL